MLRSAVANAETNPLLHWNGDDLVVQAAYADEGPTLKRWRPRARGRVNRINKRTCHITIELGAEPEGRAAAAAPRRATPDGRPRPRLPTDDRRSRSAKRARATKKKEAVA